MHLLVSPCCSRVRVCLDIQACQELYTSVVHIALLHVVSLTSGLVPSQCRLQCSSLPGHPSNDEMMSVFGEARREARAVQWQGIQMHRPVYPTVLEHWVSSRLLQCCCVRALELQIQMHFWGCTTECFCLYSLSSLPCCSLQDQLGNKKWYFNWRYTPNQGKLGMNQWKCYESKFTFVADDCLIARDSSSLFWKGSASTGALKWRGHFSNAICWAAGCCSFLETSEI